MIQTTCIQILYGQPKQLFIAQVNGRSSNKGGQINRRGGLFSNAEPRRLLSIIPYSIQFFCNYVFQHGQVDSKTFPHLTKIH